nr:hypothetical protein CCACVL1_16369 [Ipomoea batatas]
MASHVVPWSTPPPPPEKRKEVGSFSNFPNQSITMLSSSVAAGDAIQLKPTTLRPELRISPRMPGVLEMQGKIQKAFRVLKGCSSSSSAWLLDGHPLKYLSKEIKGTCSNKQMCPTINEYGD